MKDVKIECAVAKIWGVTLVILIGAVFSFAAWDGKSKTEPSIRIIDGRQFYQIGTPEELAWFANKVNSKDTALSAVLTADIDLNSKMWIPIGDTTSHAYDGVFDGNGFSIRGVSVSNKSYAGLFGVIDLGVVKN